MSRAIRFTKAEMEAVVEGIQCAEEARGTKACVKGLESLLAKMEAANQPEQATDGVASEVPILTKFREVMGDKLAWPHTAFRWAQLKKTLIEARWSEEEMRELDLSWADRPLSAHTVAAKGKEWLVTQRRKRPTIRSSAPADMEFDDE